MLSDEDFLPHPLLLDLAALPLLLGPFPLIMLFPSLVVALSREVVAERGFVARRAGARGSEAVGDEARDGLGGGREVSKSRL